MTIGTAKRTITDHEAAQVESANASSATPVVFVHRLWLLPSSWDRWVSLSDERPTSSGRTRSAPEARVGTRDSSSENK
jgi:hypothetical protein